MEKILKYIWNFINSKLLTYFIIFIIIILFANQCKKNNDLKSELIIKEQNIEAAKNDIKTYKNKNNDLIAEKAIWILSEKDLKKQNKELYNKVEDQKGKIISLNNVVINLKQDKDILHDSINYLKTTIGEAEKINSLEWKLPWKLEYIWDENNFDIFKGHTLVKIDTINYSVSHITTKMDKRESQIDLTFGEKVVDGKYNVFITSSYPGLNPKSMEGVFIDPNSNKDIKKLIEKRHWFTGFSINIGITPSWNFINQKPTIVIGPTIGYTIYQW